MKVAPLFTHSNVFAYLSYKFPEFKDEIRDIPVFELSTSEWKTHNLSGEAIFVPLSTAEEVTSKVAPFKDRLDSLAMHPRLRPDIFIFRLLQKQAAPFAIVIENNEAAIIHEIAHYIWEKYSNEQRSQVKLPQVNPVDSDEYLSSPSEQFTHMTEMEYYKSQGIAFDEWFRRTKPREFKILSDPQSRPELKELANLDYQDYLSIWNQIKTAYMSNWFTKIAQAQLKLQKGVHTGSGRPIYYLTGPTYPIRAQLGRTGLGFNWYGAQKMWWLYQEQMTPRIIQGLQKLNIDTSVLGDQPSSTAPAVPETTQPPIAPTEAVPPPQAGSMVDQSWDGAGDKSKWYGFPIKKNLYSTRLQTEVDGQPVDLEVRLHRLAVTGRRHIPSYVYEIHFNDKPVGRLSKPGPGKWRTYNEDDIARNAVPLVQEALSKKENSKTYRAIQAHLQLAQRDPALEEYLKQFSGHGAKKIQKTITLDEPGYEGEFPVEFYSYSGFNWYGQTALQHPQAPHPSTIFYLGDVPFEVKTIDEFNQWMDRRIIEEMPRAKRDYLKWLKSFAYSDEDQQQVQSQLNEVLPIIQNKSMNPEFFRQKLLERGYIRPKRRRSRGGPGLQPQDEIEIMLDSKKIVQDSYKLGKLTHSPEFFYTIVAYLMHRYKAGNIGFGAAFGQIGTIIRDFYNTLKRNGVTLGFNEVYDYFENVSQKMLNELVGIQPRGSAWDQWSAFYGGNWGEPGPGPAANATNGAALESFIDFCAANGLEAEVVRANPIKGYRTLALKFHPDRNPDNPEVEAQFKKLNALWEQVPADLRRQAMSWFYRVVTGSLIA